MGSNEDALLRLWQEKRGEVESEDLSANLIVQLGVVTEALNRTWYEQYGTDHQGYPVVGPASRELVDGRHASRHDPRNRRRVRGKLPWSFSEEAAAEKHMAQLQRNFVGDQRQIGGALDPNRRDQHSRRCALSAFRDHRRAKVLALRRIGRTSATVRR